MKADAPSNACPDGYQLLSTDTLVAEGYVVAGLVDSQTSGVLSYGSPGNWGRLRAPPGTRRDAGSFCGVTPRG